MQAFDYKAVNARGKTVKGTVMATSARAARTDLRAKNLTPTSMQAAANENSKRQSAQSEEGVIGKVKTKTLTQATRQLAILLTIYLDPPPHTVRGLAQHLSVTKPVITRALDTMGIMGLVSRRRDERDRRNVLVQRTVEGSEYLERLGDIVTEQALQVTS